jgi:hypothetical protein
MKILYVSPNNENIEISSSFVKSIEETEIPGWSDDKNKRYNKFHNMYKITLVHEGNEKIFRFYDSINNLNKYDLSSEDLLFAFKCIIEDSLSAEMSLCEFIEEYGYDNCKKASQILFLCQKTKEKINSFNFQDLYDIINHIIDYENDDKIDELIKEL